MPTPPNLSRSLPGDDGPAAVVSELVLHQIKHAVDHRVSRQLLETANLTWVADELGRALRVQLVARCLAERVAVDDVTARTFVAFTSPANWREHWKRDHADRWYGRLVARWWPPKPLAVEQREAVATVRLSKYRTFPQATIPLPSAFGAAVKVTMRDDPRWTFPTRLPSRDQ